MKRYLIKLLKLLKLYSMARTIYNKIKYYLPWYRHNYRKRLKKRHREFSRHKEMVDFFSQFIKKGDLCFDVGANIGSFTKVFLELGARVICIEPQKRCLDQLYKKFGSNDNVIIVDKAVGDQEGIGTLAICEKASMISTMSRKWIKESRFSDRYKWTIIQQVSITTLDTLILSYGQPKFCKIDVEGYEVSVLKGLTNRIPFLSFEYTGEFFYDVKNCINHLLSIGQAKFNCTIGSTMKFFFPTWITHDKLYEKLDSLKDKYKLLEGDIYTMFL